MKIYLAGSIAGKTKEREIFLLKAKRLLSFYEINNKLFNSILSFKIITTNGNQKIRTKKSFRNS